MKHEHGAAKQAHVCSYCGNTFQNKRSLFAHLKRHEDVEIECACGQTFTNAGGVLEKHQATCPQWHELLSQVGMRFAIVVFPPGDLRDEQKKLFLIVCS